MNEPLRICKACNLEANSEKELKKFVLSPCSKHGRRTLCIECYKEQNRKRSRSDYGLKAITKRYGITVSDYNEMFKQQDGCCEICGKHQIHEVTRLHIDHCHLTGKVRGLLCGNCNHLLGKAQDSISILKNAIEYLQEIENE